MGIAPTGAVYKALEFDGESSRTYGVYITGEAVYNAPERDVEMISIAGRNGSFALDKGKFQNITVTYPAGIYADTEDDFRSAISDFRNLLCSKKGYVRLTDEYNPTEYRMAIYKSGLEVTPAMQTAGEFEITFDCMPQRWLTSGESKVAVTSGDTITNPTLFDASPLLEVEGYGEILINGESVSVENVPYGDISVSSSGSKGSQTATITISTSRLNNGDTITMRRAKGYGSYSRKSGYTINSVTIDSEGDGTGYTNNIGTVRYFTLDDHDFQYGTAGAFSGSMSYTVSYTYNGTTATQSLTFRVSASYDGDATITLTLTASPGTAYNSGYSTTLSWGITRADSTVSSLTRPTYIDLDIGEAYNIVNGSASSMNNIVTLPTELPTLSPGSNTITYDNTITDLKVTPRWWKV